MKILILSDSHGSLDEIDKIISRESNVDYIFHLGDYGIDESLLEERKIIFVPGNCDRFSTRDKEIVLEIENKLFFLTHGDKYQVKWDYSNLIFEAQYVGAKVVLFGHTHEATTFHKQGITFINPGSCSKYSYQKTYAVYQDGEVYLKHF